MSIIVFFSGNKSEKNPESIKNSEIKNPWMDIDINNISKNKIIEHAKSFTKYSNLFYVKNKIDDPTFEFNIKSDSLFEQCIILLKNGKLTEGKYISNKKTGNASAKFKEENIYERIIKETSESIEPKINAIKIHTFDISKPKQLSIFKKLNSVKIINTFDKSSSSKKDIFFLTFNDFINMSYINSASLSLIFDKLYLNPKNAVNHNFSIATYLYKGKGELDDVYSFRPIMMIPTIVKLYHKILYTKLSNYFISNNYIDREICKGGIKGSSSGLTDQVLKVKYSIKYSQKKSLDYCILFIDITNAFGNVHVGLLCSILEKYSIPKNIIDYVKYYYSSFEYYFSVGKIKTKNIKLNRGIIQGCPLSMFLFNIYMNYILTVINKKCEKYGFEYSKGKFLFINAYVDDIAVICKNTKIAKEVFDLINKIMNDFGLKIGLLKSAYMSPSKIENFTLPYVTEYTYLGCNININHSLTESINELTNKVKEKVNDIMKLAVSLNDKKNKIITSIIPYINFKLSFYPELVNEHRELKIFVKSLATKLKLPKLEFTTKNIGSVNSKIAKLMIINTELSLREGNKIKTTNNYVSYSDIKYIDK